MEAVKIPLSKIACRKNGVEKKLPLLRDKAAYRNRETTNLRICILVQLGPTISPNSDDNTLVYEMFSFQRNVHHTPFCPAPLPSIQ